MRRHLLCALLAVSSVLMSACGGSKVSLTPGQPVGHAVNTIALAPSGGLLADAIGIELFNRGYTVVDTSNIIGTHLMEIIRRHAHELFSRQDAKKLLDRVA